MNTTIKVLFFDLGDTLVGGRRAWQPGAKAALAFLKSKEFRLGIISNTGNLADRTAILNLLPADFDLTVFEPGLVLFSSEVGVEKPKKEIFAKAVSAAKIPASECLYCSENPVETLAAQLAGMQSLRIITASDDIAKLSSFLIQAAAGL